MKKNTVSAFLFIIPIVILFAFLSVTGCHPEPNNETEHTDSLQGDVNVWVTMGNKLALLTRQPPIEFKAGSGDVTIQINPDEEYQSIDGFGAALTGSSAYIMMQELTPSERNSLIYELFDPSKGIGISSLRITIGSSDFSLSNYTWCDQPGLENFAVPETDQRDLIPALKEILAVAPDIQIIASPWSAPAWMKTSGTMNGGSLKEEFFSDYASYLVKFIEHMADEGIRISAITPQNEPLYQTSGYPTMYMKWEDQLRLIRDFLGPEMVKYNSSTGIWIYDHNWDNTQYSLNILADETARNFIQGTAFHAYAGNVSAMKTVHDMFPAKNLYFTEISGGRWAPVFWDNLKWFTTNIFMGTVRYWSKNALLWNLVLDENDGPKNGGCQDCRGVVTIDNHKILKNEEYYALGHFCKFVRPGALRINSGTPSGNLDWIAFKNNDQSLVLIVINTASTSTKIFVKSPVGNFPYSLPGNAIATFVWK